MTEAAAKKAFHAALGAGDPLLEGLRADLEALLIMTHARDKLVEGSPAGRNRLKLREKESFRTKLLADALNQLGLLGKRVELGGE